MASSTPAPPEGQGTSSGTYQRRKFVPKSQRAGGARLKHVKLSAVQQALEDDTAAVETLEAGAVTKPHGAFKVSFSLCAAWGGRAAERLGEISAEFSESRTPTSGRVYRAG